MNEIRLVGKCIDLASSSVLHEFKSFIADDWIIAGKPVWTVTDSSIIGGPEPDTHGQIFYKTPCSCDIVMEFDARLIAPSDHDIVWWYRTNLESKPWGRGYLAALGGWYRNLTGIESVPDFALSSTSNSCPVEPDQWYHIVSGVVASHHFIAVDNSVVFELLDPDPLPENHSGHFGFGIFQSHVEYRNLTVYVPKWQRIEEKYTE
ncbi:MAG: hypothetical protein WCV67_12075 [Victivallaceae bacterium]